MGENWFSAKKHNVKSQWGGLNETIQQGQDTIFYYQRTIEKLSRLTCSTDRLNDTIQKRQVTIFSLWNHNRQMSSAERYNSKKTSDNFYFYGNTKDKGDRLNSTIQQWQGTIFFLRKDKRQISSAERHNWKKTSNNFFFYGKTIDKSPHLNCKIQQGKNYKRFSPWKRLPETQEPCINQSWEPTQLAQEGLKKNLNQQDASG